ncbi:MAG TPA: AMP-binding protein [Mycobacteriales bacterium]|nr:AMP-binding protein [Mycobacteriales bacterium]
MAKWVPLNTLAEIWEAIADQQPRALALVHGDETQDWAAFDNRAARFAAALAAAGVRPRATVALDLFNCSEYLECFYGCLKSRAASANVNYRYTAGELRALLAAAQAEVLVYHASLADRVASALTGGATGLRLLVQIDDVGGAEVPPGAVGYEQLLAAHEPAPRIARSDDDYFIGFTGGTTGLPKGVLYTIGPNTTMALRNRTVVLGEHIAPDAPVLETVAELARAGALPRSVPASPLMHSTGLTFASLPCLAAGGAVVTLQNRSFDPHELLETVQAWRVAAIGIVGDAFARPMVHALAERFAAGNPYDTSSLRTIASAGVAWSADVKQALLQHIPQVALSDSCGSTEGAFYGNRVVRAGDEPATAVFRAQPGVQVVDADRRALPIGEVGLLASPVPTSGYFNDPQATARVFYDSDGVRYAIPGDFGRLNGDGSITLIGRGTSTINTGGEKVHPEEVEQVLQQLPEVEDCLVFGTPHERFGQQVTAIVQPVTGHDPSADTLRAAAREQLAAYKVPRRIVFGAVPRLPNGKPDFETARAVAAGDAG